MAPKKDYPDLVLKFARAELDKGPYEKPPGSNCTKYGVWYGMNCTAWCAIGASYVLDKAGITTYKHAYTPTGAQMFIDQGRWFTKLTDARPGDLIYFNFPGDGIDRIQHVGFVEKLLANGLIQTIEFNTSSGEAGSQSDGGGAYRRVRTMSLVVGFGRPKQYALKVERPVSRPKYKAYLAEGATGGDVKVLQRHLNQERDHAKAKDVEDWPELTVDGEFGSVTKDALISFQRANRSILKAERLGVAGKDTLRFLERLHERRVKARKKKTGAPKSKTTKKTTRRKTTGRR